MEGAPRLSGQRLGALASSLRSWLRFCRPAAAIALGAGSVPPRGFSQQPDSGFQHAPPDEEVPGHAAAGCIRFEHLQRSAYVTSHGPSLEFTCL